MVGISPMLRRRRPLAGLLAAAAAMAWAVAVACRGSAAAMVRWHEPAIRSHRGLLQILGVTRGRYVVGYHYGMQGITLTVNGTKLTEIKTNHWRTQEKLYGERGCNYAEFPIPSVPAEVQVSGYNEQGEILVEATAQVTQADIPSATAWNEKYMRKGGRVREKVLTLSGQSRSQALPPGRPQFRLKGMA
mmetsp:Transcript_45990/g.99895  ORF Transcript_45990/g.99895 Transcript_45990/m.99895 type:complete len:189 (+) Transcript_45990:29-595(+)|eukprot:CAMPEP_0170603068 /NCGR_PEP_ID=MMETSP0224-20130122/18721_1 /TAXON_ID=285029 /ORGANISM="Togula jolla, Strain CCCM 725" /LENGTH=188 /DNA_ID=CAMNT_0010927937 /DNA_START=32 /DNA_END=601 /DNA_ORIENTATION=-